MPTTATLFVSPSGVPDWGLLANGGTANPAVSARILALGTTGTINLPANASNGSEVTVMISSGSWPAATAFNINPNGADTLGAGQTLPIPGIGAVMRFVRSGTNWIIMAG
jgi:hypothetical protein